MYRTVAARGEEREEGFCGSEFGKLAKKLVDKTST